MKCMCAQTRPRFILSSKGVFGGMEFEPMLTPREKSPLPENVPRGGYMFQFCGDGFDGLPRCMVGCWCYCRTSAAGVGVVSVGAMKS